MSVGGPTGPSRPSTSTGPSPSTSTPDTTGTLKNSNTSSLKSTSSKDNAEEDAFGADGLNKAAGYTKKIAGKSSALGAAHAAANKARSSSTRASRIASSGDRHVASRWDSVGDAQTKAVGLADKVSKTASVARVATTSAVAAGDISKAIKSGDLGDAGKAGVSTLNAAGAGADAFSQFAKGNTGLTRAASGLGVAGGVVRTGVAWNDASKSIGKAFETGSKEDIQDATVKTADAVKSTVFTADAIKTTADKFGEFRKVDKATKAAAAKASGTIGKEAAEAAAKEARDAALKGSTKSVTRNAGGDIAQSVAKKGTDLAGKAKRTLGKTSRKAGKEIGEAAFGATTRAGKEVAEKAAKEIGEKAAKEVVEAAAKKAAKGVGKVVAKEVGEKVLKEAAEAGAKATAKALGKAAGRFAPGVNIAIAAVDTVKAGVSVSKAIDDPSFENVKNAAFDGVTAAGSILAATNIPIVSQIGGAVSAVSDIAKSIW